MAEPGIEKDNALTRFMRNVSAENAAAGLPAGRSYTSVEAPTRVHTSAMGEMKPLTPEEVSTRDALAKSIGILPKDELDELAETEEEPSAPVPVVPAIPKPGSIRNPPRDREKTTVPDGPRGGMFSPSRPMLPDFKKVECFDFKTNTIYVDGMAFPIPQDDVRSMKSYAVQIVLDHVTAQLAQALIEFGIPEAAAAEAAERLRGSVNDRKDGVVSEVSKGLAADGVSAESRAEEGLGVPPVPSAGSEKLPADGEGSSSTPAE